MLPPAVLTESLSRYTHSPAVLYRLLALVNAGKVTACADAVFALYCAAETSTEDRRAALITLASVATPDQRDTIAKDLVSAKLHSDELIAAALVVVGLQGLTVEELTTILRHTRPESDFGGNPIERAIKSDLLPTADWPALQILLTAMLRALPGEPVEALARRAAMAPQGGQWMLSVLPVCLLRAVELMVGDGLDAPQVLVDAAIIVERLQHSTYANNEDYRSLRAAIEKHQGFRRRVALAIALSPDVLHAVTRLIRMPGLVCFTRADLDWLLRMAIREDIDPAERYIWYEIARDIGLHQVHGRHRQHALAALTAGVDGPARAEDIQTSRTQRAEGIQTNRSWKREERARKAVQRRQREANKAQLLNQMDVIQDGSRFITIQWLVMYAAESSNPGRYTKVDVEPIARDFGHELAEAFSEGLTKVWRQIHMPSPADYPENRVPWTGLIGLASVNHAFTKGLDMRGLCAEEVTRAVQLCIWEYEKPEPWLDALGACWVDTIAAALMPWFEHEIGLASHDSHTLRTVDVVLRMSPMLQRPFLQRVVQRMLDGERFGERFQKRLLCALLETGVASKALIGEIASRHLMAGAYAAAPSFASDWFTAWAEVDFAAAWSWLETHATAMAEDTATLAGLVAEGLAHGSWPQGLSGTEAEGTALVSLFHFLSIYTAISPPVTVDDAGLSLPPPIQRIRDSIPGILAGMLGKAAHAALHRLVVENTGTAQGEWLQGFVLHHASAEAERQSVVAATELPGLGEVYCREPRTAGELYEQVFARLQEIREGMEGGPFSDRALFAPGIDEKKLQLWLAARLSDTPRRRFIPRFRVHREPQVDEDKRPDIEVSSAAGKVCLELKPLDATRSYSATSLTETTLREQLVGKYLRGQNSKHGVLVVCKLDDKRWEIPDGSPRGDFHELVRYLTEQAAQIEADSVDVEGLRVIGIDCVSAKVPIP